MLKAIVFDCDGVILESVDIKTRAFGTLFKDYPNCLDQILRFHLDNGGMSRCDKFAIIYRDYLGEILTAKEMTRLDAEFTRLVLAEILSCPSVPGSEEFIKGMAGTYQLFVVSGTPESELQDILNRRKLASYFRRVLGSPKTKERNLVEVLRISGFDPSEVVFVGDSTTDQKASQTVGIHFVGRVPQGSASPFGDTTRWVVSDLRELADRWETICQDVQEDWCTSRCRTSGKS